MMEKQTLWLILADGVYYSIFTYAFGFAPFIILSLEWSSLNKQHPRAFLANLVLVHTWLIQAKI